jgi:hypothetical protein
MHGDVVGFVALDLVPRLILVVPQPNMASQEGVVRLLYGGGSSFRSDAGDS